MAGKPLTNRIPPAPPPDPAAVPASALDGLFSRWARIANGSDLNTPSGRTAALRDSMLAPVAPAAPPPTPVAALRPAISPPAPSPVGQPQRFVQFVTNSGRLVAGQVQEVAGQVQGAAGRAPHSRWAAVNWIAYGVLAAGALWLLVQIVVGAVAWSTDHWATLQYGDPRTTHLSATFGFAAETSLAPTTITAVTEPGVGHIFVLPGGDIRKAFVLALPLPDDPNGRQPLQLTSKDLDGDRYPDLLVLAGNVTYPYLFDTGKQTFRPPTDAERDRIAGGGR